MNHCPHCGEPIEVRMYKRTATYDQHEALALLRAGATVREVADLYDVTTQVIYQLRNRNGLPPLRRNT